MDKEGEDCSSKGKEKVQGNILGWLVKSTKSNANQIIHTGFKVSGADKETSVEEGTIPVPEVRPAEEVVVHVELEKVDPVQVGEEPITIGSRLQKSEAGVSI